MGSRARVRGAETAFDRLSSRGKRACTEVSGHPPVLVVTIRSGALKTGAHSCSFNACIVRGRDLLFTKT